MELSQVFGALAETDVSNRYSELVADTEDDPALRRPVELRENDSRQVEGFLEEGGLLQGVLSRGRVQDQEGLVRRAVQGLARSSFAPS